MQGGVFPKHPHAALAAPAGGSAALPRRHKPRASRSETLGELPWPPSPADSRPPRRPLANLRPSPLFSVVAAAHRRQAECLWQPEDLHRPWQCSLQHLGEELPAAAPRLLVGPPSLACVCSALQAGTAPAAHPLLAPAFASTRTPPSTLRCHVQSSNGSRPGSLSGPSPAKLRSLTRPCAMAT